MQETFKLSNSNQEKRKYSFAVKCKKLSSYQIHIRKKSITYLTDSHFLFKYEYSESETKQLSSTKKNRKLQQWNSKEIQTQFLNWLYNFLFKVLFKIEEKTKRLYKNRYFEAWSLAESVYYYSLPLKHSPLAACNLPCVWGWIIHSTHSPRKGGHTSWPLRNLLTCTIPQLGEISETIRIKTHCVIFPLAFVSD